MRVVKRVRDVKQLALELQRLPNIITSAANAGILEGSDLIVLYAQEFCPPGALMRSIRKEVKPDKVAIIAGGKEINPKTGRPVDYAVYVHEGTSRMPARPFLTQAVRTVYRQIGLDIFKKTAAMI